MFSNYFLNALLAPLFTLFGSLVPVIGIVALFFFLRQRKREEDYVPPLDLVDAKKLDEMVGNQISSSLKPLLQSNGYSENQIKEILTRNSLNGQTFRR